MITQRELKEKFEFVPELGLFYRKMAGGRLRLAATVNAEGYIRFKIGKKIHLAHRMAWLWTHGELPTGDIDHINHQRNDNRPENLREVTNQENHSNQTIRKNNKSGFVGVSWNRKSRLWRAQLHANGEKMYLGEFKTRKEAAAARQAANKKYGYHPNHGKPQALAV